MNMSFRQCGFGALDSFRTSSGSRPSSGRRIMALTMCSRAAPSSMPTIDMPCNAYVGLPHSFASDNMLCQQCSDAFPSASPWRLRCISWAHAMEHMPLWITGSTESPGSAGRNRTRARRKGGQSYSMVNTRFSACGLESFIHFHLLRSSDIQALRSACTVQRHVPATALHRWAASTSTGTICRARNQSISPWHACLQGSVSHLTVGLSGDGGALRDFGPPEDGHNALEAAAEHREGGDQPAEPVDSVRQAALQQWIAGAGDDTARFMTALRGWEKILDITTTASMSKHCSTSIDVQQRLYSTTSPHSLLSKNHLAESLTHLCASRWRMRPASTGSVLVVVTRLAIRNSWMML